MDRKLIQKVVDAMNELKNNEKTTLEDARLIIGIIGLLVVVLISFSIFILFLIFGFWILDYLGIWYFN